MLNKKIVSTIGTLAVLIGPTLTIDAAHAAMASATASITDRTSALLTFSNDQYLSDASTPFQSGLNASSILQNYFFNSTNPNGDTSFASIDNTFAPFPQTSAGAAQNGSGSATVLWTFDWEAIDTGNAMLNLEYLYTAIVDGYSNGDVGIASSFIDVLLDGTSNRQEALFYFNNEDDFTSGFNNLQLDFAVIAGDIGTFSVVVASNALTTVVPVPAAAWLLGSAMAGLGGFTRRRRQAVAPALQ